MKKPFSSHIFLCRAHKTICFRWHIESKIYWVVGFFLFISSTQKRTEVRLCLSRGVWVVGFFLFISSTQKRTEVRLCLSRGVA
jgi:hypothetical protein